MRDRAGPIAVVALTTALVLGLRIGPAWVRGPDYFRWPHAPLDELALLGLLLPAALVAWAVHRGRADGRAATACCAAAALLALIEGWLRHGGPPLAGAAALLEDDGIHGYLSTARDVCPRPDWLATYPSVMPHQGIHVRVHPPGPVATYCVVFAFTGAGSGATIGAAAALGLAAASTPLWAQRLATRLGAGPRAAVIAAGLCALAPAPAAFFPSFDAVYPALTTATLLVWAVALDRGSHRWAAGAGALVWVLSSASYVLGVILVPLVALAGSVTTDAARRRRMATTAGIALVSLVVLMWAATGFDPFAVFATALDDQAGNLASSFRDRAWHETVGWDLWDFAQGLPMIVAIPALALAWRGLRTDDPIARRLASMALAGPLLAALSGALTTETFRTWMFLMPPVFVAAGRELASWPPRHLAVFLACAAVLSATWLQQLRFVWS